MALPAVAAQLGFHGAEARPLRRHDSGIFLLPRSNVVVRLTAATTVNRTRAEVALRVTGWLHERGFPTVEPVHGVPCEAGGIVATAWRYLPQPPDPGPAFVRARTLGGLLRELHAMPDPPFGMPVLDPFARLRAAIEIDDQRNEPVLTTDDRDFLAGRITNLADAYVALDFPFGVGLIHNDAHIGNLLVRADSRAGFVLADWDGASVGPREVDLVPEGAPGNRFGESAELRNAFADGYGYDIAEWAGWLVLREARDLHSLAAYIRTAPDKPASEEELRRRLGSLRTKNAGIFWGVVD